MLLQILVVLACLLAGVFQLAAHRSPDRNNLKILNTARKITAVFLLLAASYIAYCLIEFGAANVVLCFLMGGFALGQILFAMHCLYEPSTTERLMSRSCNYKGPARGSHA